MQDSTERREPRPDPGERVRPARRGGATRRRHVSLSAWLRDVRLWVQSAPARLWVDPLTCRQCGKPMPVEGTLAFAEHLVSNASRLWIEAELDQRQRLQEVFFPEGLVRELGPDLLRRAESLGLDPEESQDVVQDCFADLRRRQPDPAVVVSWLFRVVRWCALDRIRSEARRQSAEARAAEAQNPSAEENPEERLGLREAVAALPSKERRAIQARLIAGSTVAEAGARAGWKPSSAKKLFARARARLKRLI